MSWPIGGDILSLMALPQRGVASAFPTTAEYHALPSSQNVATTVVSEKS